VVDSRITFTRASAATVTNVNGIVQTLRDNKPRIDFDGSTGECKGLLIEEQRTNMFAHSENINTATWAQFVEAIVTPNAIIAPNGTQTAFKVTANTVNYPHGVGQTFGPTNLATYTVSIYAKKGELDAFRIFAWYGGAWVAFNLTSGTVTSTSGGVTSAISSVGNGWYRCSMTWTASGSDGIRFSLSDNYPNDNWAGNGTSGLYFWGPQVEPGTFATSYISSNTSFTSRASSATYFDASGILRTAPANNARTGFGYDTTSNKWISQGLILEAAATNLIANSSIFAGAFASVNTSNYTGDTAPDGTYTALRNVPNNGIVAGSSTLIAHDTLAFSNTTSLHTLSIYAKGTTSAFNRIRLYDNNNSQNCYFNLTGNGSYDTVNVASASITLVGNGWYRCSVYSSTAGTDYRIYCPTSSASATGDGTSGIYVWGAQLEAGDFATSYIPTVASTVTRQADYISFATSSFYNVTGGTLVLDATTGASVVSRTFVALNNASSTEQIGIRCTGSGGFQMFNDSASTTTGDPGTGTKGALPTIAANSRFKAAFAFAANDYRGSVNGTSVRSDTSGALATGITTINIGSRNNSTTENCFGYVGSIQYYTAKFSDAILQELSV
jgi:hypothetical protein